MLLNFLSLCLLTSEIQHKVRLTSGFWMSRCEVTQGVTGRCLRAQPPQQSSAIVFLLKLDQPWPSSSLLQQNQGSTKSDSRNLHLRRDMGAESRSAFPRLISPTPSANTCDRIVMDTVTIVTNWIDNWLIGKLS